MADRAVGQGHETSPPPWTPPTATNGATAPHPLPFFDDLKPDEPSIHLALIQCRGCHVTGWRAVRRAAELRLERDQRFFLRDVDMVYLLPADAPRVFEEYRTQLAERGVKEVDDAYRDAAALLQNDRGTLDYVAVIVDEAQDMGAQAYRLVRHIVPTGANDLFVVGDGHQRIYGRNKVVLGRCGIDVRGRSRKLRLNYRTTEETRSWAARLLAGRAIDDLDGGRDVDKGITSLTRGPEPLLEHFENREDQSAFIVAYLKKVSAEDSSLRGVCVVARTGRERDAIADVLKQHDLTHVVLEAGAVDAAEKEGVRLATMHRVKGLEFDRVIMASVNADLVPLPVAIDARGDAVERESAETEERALVYVAATRAKKELLVLSYDKPSRFL